MSTHVPAKDPRIEVIAASDTVADHHGDDLANVDPFGGRLVSRTPREKEKSYTADHYRCADYFVKHGVFRLTGTNLGPLGFRDRRLSPKVQCQGSSVAASRPATHPVTKHSAMFPPDRYRWPKLLPSSPAA